MPTVLASAGSAVGLALASVVAARTIGPGGFGLYAVSLVLIGIVSLAFGLGTGTALRLLVAEHGDAVFGGYLRLSVVMGLLVGAICFAIGRVQDQNLAWSAAMTVVGYATFAGRQLVDGLHARGKTGLASTAVFGGSALFAVTIGWLAYSGSLTPLNALLANALCLLPVLGASFVDWRSRPWEVGNATLLDTAKILVLRGLPTLGMNFSIFALQRSDRLILAAARGDAIVGVYAAAASIAESGRIISQAVGQVAFYRATEPGAGRSPERLRNANFVVIVFGAIVGIALAPWIIKFVFGPAYADATTPLQILLGAEAAFSLTLIQSRILIARGKARTVGAIGVVSTIGGIGVYAALIPAMGILGAAVGTVLAYSGVSAALLLVKSASPKGKRLEPGARRRP